MWQKVFVFCVDTMVFMQHKIFELMGFQLLLDITCIHHIS